MNLHLLRIFVTVAQHLSFSRAAEVLHVSQPAVSKGVREFEAQVGNPLLERGHGGIRLTEAGELLLRHARALFVAEQYAQEALDALKGLNRGTLRIGASTTIATYFLPPFLGMFYIKYPSVELRLMSTNTVHVAELLMQRELDIALVEGPIESAELIAAPWRNDELVFIVSPHHPLADCDHPIDMGVFENEIIVMREQGSGTRDVAYNVLSKNGCVPKRTLEVSSNEAIARTVAAGLGIGIVSSAVVADHVELGRLKRITIGDLRLHRKLARLYLPNRQQSPAAEAFNKLLDSEA